MSRWLLRRRGRPPQAGWYYVDSTGSDSNPGSLALPWQTVSKVNAATLNPGDRVHFRRGQTFTGELTPGSSGADGRAIVYGAYGSGDRPVIDGVSSTIGALRIDGPTVHHLRFESLSFYRSAAGNDHQVGRVRTHDVYLYDCEFSYGGDFGCSASLNDGANIYNLTWDHCVFHHNYRSGIYVGGNTAPGPHDILIVDCESHHNGWNNDGVGNGFYVKAGCTLLRCYSHDNIEEGGLKTNNLDIGVEPTIYFPVVRDCLSVGDRDGLYCASKGSQFFNNLVIDATSVSMTFDDTASGCTIVHNTLVNARGAAGVNIREDNTGNVIENNLIIQDYAVTTKYLVQSGAPDSLAACAAANTWDYNVYYRTGSPTSASFYDGSIPGGTTWNAWAGYGVEAHGLHLTALPGFVTRYTDLHPAAGGNLVGLGTYLADYATDKDGKARANPPTPGCYEAV